MGKHSAHVSRCSKLDQPGNAQLNLVWTQQSETCPHLNHSFKTELVTCLSLQSVHFCAVSIILSTSAYGFASILFSVTWGLSDLLQWRGHCNILWSGHVVQWWPTLPQSQHINQRVDCLHHWLPAQCLHQHQVLLESSDRSDPVLQWPASCLHRPICKAHTYGHHKNRCIRDWLYSWQEPVHSHGDRRLWDCQLPRGDIEPAGGSCRWVLVRLILIHCRSWLCHHCSLVGVIVRKEMPNVSVRDLCTSAVYSHVLSCLL